MCSGGCKSAVYLAHFEFVLLFEFEFVVWIWRREKNKHVITTWSFWLLSCSRPTVKSKSETRMYSTRREMARPFCQPTRFRFACLQPLSCQQLTNLFNYFTVHSICLFIFKNDWCLRNIINHTCFPNFFYQRGREGRCDRWNANPDWWSAIRAQSNINRHVNGNKRLFLKV